MYKPSKKTHVHFIGIGGIGMSGIATILYAQGYIISGCDLDLDQTSIRNLKELGCSIYEGNNAAGCNNHLIDIVVYSSAIKINHPEIISAQRRGIPTISRALMLAELMRTKYSIAVTGSHGKTTTTSLISHLLMEASMDPTVIIGGHLHAISSNARMGSSEFLVAEADESDRSLIQLHASIAILTNISLEHLETYKDIEDIKATFKQFLSQLPFYGKAIVCIDNDNVRSLLPIPHIKTISYGLTQEADIYADNILLYPTYSTFTVHTKNDLKPLGNVHLNMPGEHNILNALAACTLGIDLEISFACIAQALESFKGVDRRFSYRGEFNTIEVFDDYAHHPVEITNILKVARHRAKNNLIVIFQPHRFTRTKALWNEFLAVLEHSPIDHLIITDIFPASEDPIPFVSSKLLVEDLKRKNVNYPLSYIPYQENFEEMVLYINTIAQPEDLLLLLGAGVVNKIAPKLIKK